MLSKQYHINLSKDMLKGASYAIVTGDPERVPLIAKALDNNAQPLSHHRGFVSYLVYLKKVPVLVTTTGIGGPSTSIIIEELASLGIKYFLRVGTSGTIQEYISLGDIIISEASVRLDGASTHYAPIEYPAVASFGMTASLVNAAQELGIPHHIGITASTDTFYPGQERYDHFNHYVLKRMQGSLNEWQKLRVLNYEMESSTMFTMCRVFGLEAACFCGVGALRLISETPSLEALVSHQTNWFKLAARTLELDFKRTQTV